VKRNAHRPRPGRLCRQHDPKDTIICVSHADPIKLAVAYYLGLGLDNFQRLVGARLPSRFADWRDGRSGY
jgi:broad specificity phosphatase PhoE